MAWIRTIAPWLAARDWRSRADIERDIDEEIAFHLDMRTHELVQHGLGETAARRAAEARFGDVARVKRTCGTVQIGERIMLQRFHVILLAVLVVAVLAVGLQSFTAQSSSRAEIGRMSDEIRRLTTALRSSSPSAQAASQIADPTPGTRLVAAQSTTLEAAAAPFDPETASAHWLDRFEKSWSWRTALALGEELSELPPDESLAILSRIYARIPAIESRQQLLKSFVFDGAKPNACEVLHLAATDKEIAVQAWGFLYLKAFAWRDFCGDPETYATWRAQNAGRPLPEVLARSTDDFLDRVRTQSGPALQRELDLAARIDPRVLAQHLPEQALELWRSDALVEAERCAANSDTAIQERALALAAQVGIDEGFRARTVEPLLAPGCQAHDEVRAAAVRALDSAEFEGKTARLAQLYERGSRGASHPDAVASAALSALAGSRDPRVIPELIGVLVRNDAPPARRDVGSALHALTGVTPDDAHGPDFWVEWFAKNRDRLPPELRSVDLSGKKGF